MMNARELIVAFYDILSNQLTSDCFLAGYLVKITSLARASISSLIILAWLYTWSLIEDAASLARFTVGWTCLVLLICFIKSLKPRYNFIRKDSKRSNNEEVSPANLLDCSTEAGRSVRLQILKRIIKESLFYPLSSNTKESWIREIWSLVKKESHKIRPIVSRSLSSSDAESLQHQLPWADTRIDVETVQWINQILQTLWSTIRSLLDQFVLSDIFKKKKKDPFALIEETEKLAKHKRAKLSVYISSRQKLTKLLKFRSEGMKTNAQTVISWTIIGISYVFKLFMIYMKQFVIDYVKYIFSEDRDMDRLKRGSKRKKVDLAEVLARFKPEKGKNQKLNKSKSECKSWAGFGIDQRNGSPRKKLLNRTKSNFRSRSAPSGRSRKFLVGPQSFGGPRCMARLREKRVKSAKKLIALTSDEVAVDREISFEEIKFGNRLPCISGIKCLEESHEYHQASNRSARLPDSDGSSEMKLIFELSYASDQNFGITFSSVPLLNRIKLTGVSFRLRLSITLNHLAYEVNKNADLLMTPDEVLFPALNHIQVTIIDLPQLDWSLERPKMLLPISQGKGGSRANKAMNSRFHACLKFFDLVYIVNSTYFKYIMHSFLYIILRWFRPFDVRIGDSIYIKTIC